MTNVTPELALTLAGVIWLLLVPPAQAALAMTRRAPHRSSRKRCGACRQWMQARKLSNTRLLREYTDYLHTSKLRADTKALYLWAARDYIGHLIERGRAWHTVGVDVLLAWGDRATRGSHKGRRLAPRSQDAYTGAVAGMYRWAYAGGLIERDPMVNRPRAARHEQAERYIDRPSIRHAIAAAAEDGDWRVVLILHLALGAGMRRGAIAALRIEDVRLSAGVLTAAQKGGGTYRVPIGTDLAEVLTGVLAGRPRYGALITRLDGSGEGVTADYVSRLANRHLRACGIDETLHALRHTAGKEIAEAEDIRAASGFLGHASIATTERVYLKGADAGVWRGVRNRPPLREDFEVMGPPGIRGPSTDRDLHGLGRRSADHPTPVLGAGHEPSRRRPSGGDIAPTGA